ncbi:MAG: hypothetical protein JW959_10195 [Pirellulales bacterium]|nr:hypothetical protein [Pirellulales bacterium]
MLAIRAHFDGKALIPEELVELPRDQTLIIHVESEKDSVPGESLLRPVLVPSDPELAKQMIHDPECGLENF